MVTATSTKTAPDILTRLYEAEAIMVGPTTGQETLAESGDVFRGFLDSNFDRWGTNVSGDPTESKGVEVWEQAKNANFRTVFDSLGDPNDLCLTQGQILEFVAEHRDKLHPRGWATFFLFKARGGSSSPTSTTTITNSGRMSTASA